MLEVDFFDIFFDVFVFSCHKWKYFFFPLFICLGAKVSVVVGGEKSVPACLPACQLTGQKAVAWGSASDCFSLVFVEYH